MSYIDALERIGCYKVLNVELHNAIHNKCGIKLVKEKNLETFLNNYRSAWVIKCMYASGGFSWFKICCVLFTGGSWLILHKGNIHNISGVLGKLL